MAAEPLDYKAINKRKINFRARDVTDVSCSMFDVR